MTEIEIIGDTAIPETEIRFLAKCICENEDPTHEYRISLKMLDSNEMQHYNKVYRGKDETTDILSFVSDDIELPTPQIGLRNKDKQTPLPRPLRLCDILIDTKRLVEQMGNKTLEEEFRIVFIHGLLHLVGYDHVRTLDTKEMNQKEEIYQNMINQGEEISGRR